MEIGYYKSPWGWIEIQVEDKHIIGIQFTDCAKPVENSNEIIKICQKQLAEYCFNHRTNFNLPIKFNGTAFQKKVWEALCKISYGQTVSYQQIAKNIGNIKAVRAVGAAIGKNPIAIVVPCHRVIGSNGSMTGYAYGIDLKEQLLKLEKNLI